MSSLLTLILVLTSLSMFVIDREHKLAVMFFYCMCMTCFQPSPVLGTVLYVPVCFFLSEIPFWVDTIKKMKHEILLYATIGMIFITLILFLKSPHYLSLKGFMQLFRSELLWKYFVIVYAYICIKDKESINPLLKTTMIGLLFLFFFGIINYLTKQADFVTAALEGAKVDAAMEGLGELFTLSDRFRVQSMFLNPFDYGYICILSSFLLYYGYKKQIISGFSFSIFFCCCLFGIFTCGCRTIVLVFTVSILFVFFMNFSSGKRIRVFLAIALLTLCAYQIKPIQDTFDNTLTVFQKKSDVSGSSLELRAVQFVSVLYHIQGNYMFGKGKDYFNIDMGWQDGGIEGLVDEDLYGTEGIYLKLLLERGVVGLLAFYFYLFAIGFILYRNRRKDPITYSFGLTVLLAYFLFTHATGELSSSRPSFLLWGMAIGILQLDVSNEEKEVQE